MFSDAKLRGFETLWVIADEFGTDSFRHYFYNNEQSYANETFEVTGFLTKALGNADKSPLSRMVNSLTYAMQEKLSLPKIILFVFEDDIIKHRLLRTKTDVGKTEMYTRVLKWFSTNVERAVEAFKEYLPLKCKRQNLPRIVLLSPATNINFNNNNERRRFGKSLNIAAKLHHNMSCLQLRQGWDEHDTKVFINEGNINRWTAEGLDKFWSAVDKCIQFCNTSIDKKPTFRKQRFPPRHAQNQHYQTTNYEDQEIESYNTMSRDDLRWQLPPPRHSQKRFLQLKIHPRPTCFTLPNLFAILCGV